MIRKYVLPVLALFGLYSAVRTVLAGSKPPPLAVPISEPSKPPFADFVAGSGLIESNTENIAIASPLSGVVTQVFTPVGTEVRMGDPLFRLDDREMKANLELNNASVAVAQALLNEAVSQLNRIQSMKDRTAMSEEEFSKRKYAVQIAEARLKEAQAQMGKTLTDLERLTVTAPISGTVLQVRVRIGEFAPAQLLQNPLMIIGSLNPLHVRVDVDENDAWRILEGARGHAFLRGNSEIQFPLKFVRFEPYVIPKRNLSGESTERVDTRVLQLIYSFEGRDSRLFPGQFVDVFIESKN